VAKLAISGRLPLSGTPEVLRFTDSATAELVQGMAHASVAKP